MNLYFQKDAANDQVYIGLARGADLNEVVKETVQVNEDITLDLDESGQLLGIDISNASKVLGKNAFTISFEGDEIIGVAEASKLCGVKKPNFIRDYASRSDFPRPVADLASGRLWYKSSIEAYLREQRPNRTHREKERTGSSTVFECLLALLASDELAFRHSALTYVHGVMHPEVPNPPTIETITADSIQEDRSLAAQAQAGQLELYLDAAMRLLQKYSHSLESYISGASPESVLVKAIAKDVWVEALKRMQRGDYGPHANVSFTTWLLTLTNEVLASHGIQAGASPDVGTDPLEADARAKMYEEALRSHQSASERRRAERLVLEYVSRLSSEELDVLVSSASGRISTMSQVRSLLDERLEELSTRN